MKKFTLLFLSMFCMLGAAVAQDKDDEAFALQYTSPKNGASVFSVNFIQLGFNKDVTVTLPEGGIEVKNTETGEGLKLTRVYEDPYMSKNMVMLMFEQRTVIDEKDGKEKLEDMYINTPGTYSYTIPAGVITSVDNEVFPEQTFTFTIAKPLAIESVSPNSSTTQLDKIVFTFSTPIAEVKIPASGMYIVDNYWTPVVKIKDSAIISEDKKSVTLELETPITKPGGYNLDVYEGIFVSEDGGINESRSFQFQIIDTAPSFSLNYKEGEKVKELGNLEITFKNVKEVKLAEGADPIIVYIPGDSEIEGTATLADNKITVSFGELTEEGVYTYVIPAGFFTMDGVENEERSVSVELYTFVITPLEIVSVTPVEGNVAQIDKIIIEFNQNVSLSWNENWQQISQEIVLKGEDKEYKLTYNSMSTNVGKTLEYLANAQWTGYEFAATPITAAGKYTLDLSQIVVDHAGEDYIDEWGYPNTMWHSKNQVCPGSKTWTISGGGTPDVPTPEIDLTKAYRVKDVVSNKYLHVGDYEAHPGGVNGGVKVEAKEESDDQIFTIEEAGNGQYYLKSLEGHYIVCRTWNVDGSMDEKTALGFEFINETEFYITNANGYFKVENVNGVDYPFCDAGLDKAATWVLEEADVASGIEDITAGSAVKTIYDLTGRRIENITKAGIYIVNGKKVLVK